jgi:uncharacterized protein DUF4124
MHYGSRIPLTGALALAACLALFLPDPTSAEMYQWTDKAGNKGFADSLEKVPPQYRNSAKRLEETKGSTKTFQRVPTPPGLDNTMPSAPTDEGESYALWQQRMTAARAELDALKAQREKVQTAYDALRRPTWIPTLRLFPIDPEKVAQAEATLKELEQRIRDKEYEISTTIPDEARRAGVPHGALSP